VLVFDALVFDAPGAMLPSRTARRRLTVYRDRESRLTAGRRRPRQVRGTSDARLTLRSTIDVL